jgi:hypothetical protein
VNDAFERVLQLVAEGRLSAEEAAPLLDALEAAQAPPPSAPAVPGERGSDSDDTPASAVRIEVSDAGRKVINLRIPLALGRTALRGVPGLSEATTEQIREAISAGVRGPVFDVLDDRGDGVRVMIE